MTVRGLYDARKLYRGEKTTIRKGNIVREQVWRDAAGRIYEVERDEIHSEELFWCVSVILFMVVGFFLGYVLARRNRRKMEDPLLRRTNEKEIQIRLPA